MKSLLYIFLALLIFNSCTTSKNETDDQIMTVLGPIDSHLMGITLEHEHVTTDFIGAEIVKQPQYPAALGLGALLPYFKELKSYGVSTFIECTPKYIGRDVLLLKELSKQSDLHILTNTGYYAAVDKKYLPAHIYQETSEQLAKRWIEEWRNGIDGTGIKPGFIKLGVGKKHLDSIEQKIVTAGALTHLATGLKIAIHTGSAIASNDELDILKNNGVRANALIIVHAQNATSEEQIDLIKKGAWVSLDGINGTPESINKYMDFLLKLKNVNFLEKVLISHDDGWSVVKNENSEITFERFGNRQEKPFSPIFEKLIPELKNQGFTQEEIDQLLIKNPAEAYKIEVCRLQ